MPKLNNIYDLVERAAARGVTPRLELWQRVASALLSGELPVENMTELIGLSPAITFFDWLGGSPASCGGFKTMVDRGRDPHRVAHILARIMVPDSKFQRWLRVGAAERRGPRRGTTGYQSFDRTLFPGIKKLMKTGAAISPYGAALLLFDEGKIKGHSRISAAKRVSALFRRENPYP